MRSIARAALLLLACSASARAQQREVEVALGVAQPSRGLAAARRSGPLARASLKFVGRTHGWQLRVDGEAVELRGRTTAETNAEVRGAYRSLGAFLTLSAGPRRFAVRPYVLASFGAQRVSIAGAVRTPRVAAGARYGGGVRVVLPNLDVALEIARHGVLSGYGVSSDYSLGGYRPVTLSITF